MLVVAFKAGATKHPSWFINMARKPECVWIAERGARARVSAVTLHGEDRERAWQRILAEAPAFRPYWERGNPEVPIVRLSLVDSQGSTG